MNNVNGDKSYFEVHIQKDGTYYITEEQKKSKAHGSALSTLKNIEKVVAGNLKYSSNHPDNFSALPKEALLKLFKEHSQDINKRYNDAAANSNWLFRSLFGKEKEVKAVETRINNLIQPPKMLLLPDDIIQRELAKYLNITDTAALSSVNREGMKQLAPRKVELAREIGFEGTDATEATKYLKEFYNEVKYLHHQGFIPKEYVVYTEKKGFFGAYKKVDVEATAKNLKGIDTIDIIQIFGRLSSWNPRDFKRFTKIRKFFSLGEVKSLEAKPVKLGHVNGALLASSVGEIDFMKFLLKNGVDPNPPNYKPLNVAAYRGDLESAKLLLEYGAKINAADSQGMTPLIQIIYSDRPNLDVVEFLLQNGANQNISYNGFKAVDYAQRRGNQKLVELLKLYGGV